MNVKKYTPEIIGGIIGLVSPFILLIGLSYILEFIGLDTPLDLTPAILGRPAWLLLFGVSMAEGSKVAEFIRALIDPGFIGLFLPYVIGGVVAGYIYRVLPRNKRKIYIGALICILLLIISGCIAWEHSKYASYGY